MFLGELTLVRRFSEFRQHYWEEATQWTLAELQASSPVLQPTSSLAAPGTYFRTAEHT